MDSCISTGERPDHAKNARWFGVIAIQIDIIKHKSHIFASNWTGLGSPEFIGVARSLPGRHARHPVFSGKVLFFMGPCVQWFISPKQTRCLQVFENASWRPSGCCRTQTRSFYQTFHDNGLRDVRSSAPIIILGVRLGRESSSCCDFPHGPLTTAYLIRDNTSSSCDQFWLLCIYLLDQHPYCPATKKDHA